MANILKSFFSQCARPKGALGRVMLSFMNYTHAPLTNWGLKLVEGMTAYSPEDLKKLLDEAGFTQTEIHRKKPTYATIIGVKA